MEHFKKLAQEQLGLGDLEARCYELLLIKTKATVGEICGYVDLDQETEFEKVKQVLEGLAKKGLAQKLPKAKGLVDVYVGVPPFEGFTKKLTTFSAEMGQAKKTMEQSMAKIRADAEKNVAETKSHVGTIVTQAKTDTEQNAAAANQGVAQATDIAVKTHNDALEKGKATLQQTINATISANSESLKKFQTQVGEESTSCQGKVGETVSARKKDVTGTCSTFSQGHTTAVNAFKDGNLEKATKVNDQIVEKLKSLDKGVKDLLQRGKETHAAGVMDAQQKAIADYTANKDLTGKTLEKWQVDLSSALKTTESTAKGQLSTKMTASVDDNVAKLNAKTKDATTAFGTLKTNLEGTLAKAKTSLDTTLQTQKGAMGSFLDQQAALLEKNLTAGAGTFATGIDAQNKTLEAALGEQSKALDKNFTDLLTQMKTFLDARKTAIAESLAILKKQVDEKVAGIKTLVTAKFQEYEGGVKKQFDALKMEINNNLQQFSSSTASETEKFAAGTSQNVNLLLKGTADHATNFSALLKAQASEVTTTIAEIFTSANSMVDKQCTTHVQGLQKTLGENLTAFTGRVKDTADKSIKEMAEKTQVVETQVSAPFQEGCSATTALLTDFKTQLGSTAGTFLKQSGDVSKKMETDVVNTLAAVHADATRVLQGFTTTAGTVTSKQTTEIGTALTSLNTKSAETLSSTVGAFSTATSTLRKDLEMKITGLKESIKSSAEKINGDTNANLDKFATNMLGSYDAAVETVLNPIANIGEVAAKNAEFLGVVWNDVKAIELLKAEGTWQVVTRRTIQMYIDAMVRRTKTLCVIVVPDMSLLPMNAIRASKKTQKITVASKITDKALADELAKMQNIDLREVTEYPVNVFGANRDQEEAFYGPATEKPDEMVCTISQQDDLIKVIAEMLSSFYRGRSRKYASAAE